MFKQTQNDMVWIKGDSSIQLMPQDRRMSYFKVGRLLVVGFCHSWPLLLLLLLCPAYAGKGWYVRGLLFLLFDFTRGHVAQVANQLIELVIVDDAFAEGGHPPLWPMSQALWVADVVSEEVAAEVFGRIVGDV